MATVKVALKDWQPKKDGTIPILLRITIERKVKYISTGYSVKINQFKEGDGNWVHHHPDGQLINAAIEKKRSSYMAEVYTADIAGAKINVKDFGKKKNIGKSFYHALQDQKEIFEKRGQVSAYDKLTTRINNLKSAWDSKPVTAGEINKHWVDKYINDRYQKNASPNTVKKDLSIFASVLENAEEFAGKNPFKLAQKTIVKVPINRESLTAEEIKLLETTFLTGLVDVARDMFLFAYYTHGMRFQSVAMFERSFIKGKIIRYRMNKGQKMREVEIHPKLQTIIDKYKSHKGFYLFPVIKTEIKDEWQKGKEIDTANAMINLRLKRAAIICGIEKNLTSHIAKHTFAKLSLDRGVSYEVLKDALGHSDYATTQMYLKSLSDAKINREVIGLYD